MRTPTRQESHGYNILGQGTRGGEREGPCGSRGQARTGRVAAPLLPPGHLAPCRRSPVCDSNGHRSREGIVTPLRAPRATRDRRRCESIGPGTPQTSAAPWEAHMAATSRLDTDTMYHAHGHTCGEQLEARSTRCLKSPDEPSC